VPPTRRTALFAKQPVPGRVKTRLCPPLTPAEAAALAEAMLLDAAERLAAAPGLGPRVCFAPAEAQGWFRRAVPAGLALEPQRGPRLAARLSAWFEGALTGGATAVAVGADCPELEPEHVERAHGLLEDGADVVIGPDAGGGYHLIGLRAPVPALFERVPMSTAGMGDATVRLARELGLRVELTPPVADVDVPADLVALAARLEAGAPVTCPRTARTLRELQPALAPARGLPPVPKAPAPPHAP
jgi:rSAM/selenodomain-associated transferase 1